VVRRSHRGKTLAWVVLVHPHSGKRLPSELVADTLDELRAMLRRTRQR